MVLPERMVLIMGDNIQGEIIMLSQNAKLLIQMKCKNNIEGYSTTFPFIAREDLENTHDPFFLSVVNY